MDKQAAEKVGRAKAGLVISQPFFASLILTMSVTEDNTFPTMATNGKWVKYNSDFVNGMTLEQTKFVLCHEVMHCVFQHVFTRGERNPYLWNAAGDYIINDILTKEGRATCGEMPAMGLLDERLVAEGEGMTEKVYELLLKKVEKRLGHKLGQGAGVSEVGKGLGGTPLDDLVDPGGSEAERNEAEADMRVRVAQAAQAAKMSGKLSANLGRFVDQALNPKVDWKEVLRRFVSQRIKENFTYARPNRRWLGEELYLPSKDGYGMGDIIIAVDCSGSIGDVELAEFAAEMKAIKEDVLPMNTHVIYFDSRVCHYDKFERDDDLTVAPHGGGGTAFSPVFVYAEEQGIEPACCVFLTDLYCNDFGPPTPYPTLWVSTGANQAPWGEVVMMK